MSENTIKASQEFDKALIDYSKGLIDRIGLEQKREDFYKSLKECSIK